MSILGRCISIFAPHICIGCGREEDRLLRTDCMAALSAYLSGCYRCGISTHDYMVCNACTEHTPLITKIERVNWYTV